MKKFTGDSRTDAAIILEAVINGHERSSDLTNHAASVYKDPRDFGLLRELVGGVLRRRQVLIKVVEKHISQGMDKTRPMIRELLLCHAYQAMFLTRIPVHARVSGSVNAARRLDGDGPAKFVNAVTRAVERDLDATMQAFSAAELLSIPYVFAELIKKAEGRMPDPAELESLTQPQPIAVRVSCDPDLRADAEKAIIAAESTFTPGEYALECLILDSGRVLSTDAVPRLLVPQDEASQLVVQALDPKDGEKILDLCCGTGIKTSQILDCAPGAEVLAVDNDTRKLDRCKELCRTAGRGKPRVLGADGTNLPADMDGSFDAVLLDAPCTGSGTIRRRPEVRYARVESDFAKAAVLQEALLQRALRLVRPGGRVVYAVCSFAAAEGPDVVRKVLAANPGFGLESTGIKAPFVQPDQTLMIFPWRHDLDGFYIARIVRKA